MIDKIGNALFVFVVALWAMFVIYGGYMIFCVRDLA